MRQLNVDLENCYGIKNLHEQFDFSNRNAYAIYAPNGAMKSCLAQTFKDVADATASSDRVFPTRVCTRQITDESGADLAQQSVLVFHPYDEEYGHTARTSTLLVNSKLRKEYEELHEDIDKSKQLFLRALKQQSGSRKDPEKEISDAFTSTDNSFYRALIGVEGELLAQKNAPFADIPYDIIFDDRVQSFLKTSNVKTAIDTYIRKYNQLLDASMYFKKGFNFYNAGTISKSLSDNGFFAATHTVKFNGDETLEITTPKQLQELIEKQKEQMSKDPGLRETFDDLEKLIHGHANLRVFENYLADHEELLPYLDNVESFRREVLMSYLRAQFGPYNDLITKYKAAENRKKEIEDEASKQATLWESVIEIFNSRFFVPFKLVPENKMSVVLGEPVLNVSFIFRDDDETAPVEKADLMRVLSTGEKKALYILNIIFEVTVREQANQETLFVFDDIADSFDYKNKYAIIQYLQDIAEKPHFKQIILTHNFDFFRTIKRFVGYEQCLMAVKSTSGISFKEAQGINNVFVKDWKPKFFDEPKKRIASIPFIRNLIEYTKGKDDPDYTRLTSLLHWKSDSAGIKQTDLDAIYNRLFPTHAHGTWLAGDVKVIDTIQEQARECLTAPDGINFENKIVLSIATRIAAEQFMWTRITDNAFLQSITTNPTPKLLKEFKKLFGGDTRSIETLQRVVLMTPQNIHLNSFMYEPIMDISDTHLRQLYQDVLALS